MKTQLSSLEIKYILEEFKILIGAKVDTIINPEKNELLIQFFVSGQGKKILRILPNFIYLTLKKKSQETPSGFCMNLRKHLTNARLRDITQISSERIVEFLFETKEGKFIMIVELFSKGNIILCKKDYTILSVLESQKWKDRELKTRIKYEFPPQKLNFFELEEEKLIKLFNSDKPLVKKLASDLGLGGVYAEEVCLLSKLDKEKIKLSKKDIKKIAIVVNKITKKKTKASIVYENESLKDIVPFNLEFYKENEVKNFENYNSALDFVLTNISISLDEDEKVKVYVKKIEKVNKIIKKQNEKIKEIEDNINENEKNAEIIYSNYNLLKEVIEEIKKATKKYSWKEIKEKLKGHKVVKEINSKDKKVILELK